MRKYIHVYYLYIYIKIATFIVFYKLICCENKKMSYNESSIPKTGVDDAEK